MNFWKFAASAVLATGLNTAAQASVIFDSTTLEWGSGGDYAGSSFGQSFNAPASGGTVSQVSLLLQSDDAGTGSILVYIMPDDGGGYPDFFNFTQIGAINDTDFAAAYTPELITLSVNYVLTPNSSYWLLIDPVNSDIAWLANETTPAVGIASIGALGFNGGYQNTAMFDGTDPFPVGDFGMVFGMKVQTLSVPEPLSLTLFGTGLLGLGLVTSLRRRKAA